MGKSSNYVIQPRGKALYEDETSFGSRMLAKMGWSKGKGLGANENGAKDFIRVRYKNDIGGFGFSSRDDQWTENEFTFNSLLKNLNEENDAEDKEEEEGSVKKIKSLEEKSKKSRSRVHYQKFTRGKDLSRYSEKDLANIFGKKSLNDSYKAEKKDESSSESSTEATNVEDSKMINTGVSITDYFKNKRLAMKNGESVTTEATEEKETEPEEVPKKKKKKSKKKSSDEESDLQTEEPIESEPEKKKKSKKAKRKEESEEVLENTDPVEKSTKTKKNKKSTPNEEPVPEPCETIVSPNKKSKKRKLSSDNTQEETTTKKQKNDTSTTIIVGDDMNKYFLDSIAVEKLKSLRLEKFKDSNVANIVGYGLSKDIKLEVFDSSIIKGISHVNKYSIYANVDKMHSKQYYKSLLLRYHKKRNTFKM